MRNIVDYTDKYAKEPFESTMVVIRKKMVIVEPIAKFADNARKLSNRDGPDFGYT